MKRSLVLIFMPTDSQTSLDFLKRLGLERVNEPPHEEFIDLLQLSTHILHPTADWILNPRFCKPARLFFF